MIEHAAVIFNVHPPGVGHPLASKVIAPGAGGRTPSQTIPLFPRDALGRSDTNAAARDKAQTEYFSGPVSPLMARTCTSTT